jgi:hypothetical protein
MTTKYIFMADWQYGTQVYRAGDEVDTTFANPVAAMIAEGAPLTPYEPEIAALLRGIAARNDANSHVMYSAMGPRPIVLDSNGDAHVYVNSSLGSDAYDGTSTKPFVTFQKGVDRARQWLRLRQRGNIFVHLHGTFSEYVDIITDATMLGDLIIVADIDDMTVADSGVSTAGDANSLTDSGASWGIASEQVDKILHTFLETNQGATERWICINDHTATVLKPVAPFTNSSGLAVAANYDYELLSPKVVVGNPGTRPTRSTIEIYGPDFSSLSDFPNLDFPKVRICFVQINNSQAAVGSQIGSVSVAVHGGFYAPVGVVYGGTNGGVRIHQGALCRPGLRGAEVADPAFGVSDNWKMRWCAHMPAPSGTGRVGLHVEGGCHFDAFVSRALGGVLSAHGGNLQTNFGASHSGGIVCEKHSRFMLTPGGSTNIPFLVKNVPAGQFAGVDYQDQSFGVWASPIKVDTSLVAAARVNGASLLRVVNTGFTKNAITGYTLDVQNGGRFHTTVALTPGAGTAGEIRVDTATGTFAGLAATTLVDSAARRPDPAPGATRSSHFPFLSPTKSDLPPLTLPAQRASVSAKTHGRQPLTRQGSWNAPRTTARIGRESRGTRTERL